MKRKVTFETTVVSTGWEDSKTGKEILTLDAAEVGNKFRKDNRVTVERIERKENRRG
jgi:hypothetical protein